MINSIDHAVMAPCDEVRRIGLWFGQQNFKQQNFNVHQPSVAAVLKAQTPTVGYMALNIIASVALDGVAAGLRDCGAQTMQGPVQRAEGHGSTHSVFVRAPDDDLGEIAECTH